MIPLTRPFGWRGHVCLRVSASGHHLLRVIFLSCAINFLSPESINAVNVFFLLSVGLCLLMSKPFCSSWRIKNTIFMFMFMFFFFFFWLRLHNLMYVCDGMGLLLFSLFVYLLQDSMKYSKSSENWSGDLKSLSLALFLTQPPPLSLSLSLWPDPCGASSKKDPNITYQLDDQFRAYMTAAAQRWSSDQWNTVGDTTDHTHILIRPSDWMSRGCLDHYHGFHANWTR